MERDFDLQIAEVQVRIAVLNGYTALGTPPQRAYRVLRGVRSESFGSPIWVFAEFGNRPLKDNG